jgi:predicted S18 family serine protease
MDENKTNEILSSLGFAIERVYSAEEWSEFFGTKGKKFDFNAKILKESCIEKLTEAEERYQYTQLFFPGLMESTKEKIDGAYTDLKTEDFKLCLFKASKAKAQANIVLSTLGVEEDQVDNLIKLKLEAAGQNIVEEQKKGIFPISGYSYYEYAHALIDEDKYNALLYAEYALELSNLDMYFESKKRNDFVFDFNRQTLFIFITGIGAGILISIIAILITGKITKKKRIKVKKNKKRVKFRKFIKK